MFRPVSVSEYFSNKLDVLVFDLLGMLSALEFTHEILAEIHVSEHLRYPVNGIVTALHFEFLKHEFFCVLGKVTLVEESGGQVLGVGLDENITTVEATEKSDDRVQALVDLCF